MEDEANHDIDWSLTTWEGSRRAQMRHWMSLTLRERLKAVDEMDEVARHFEAMRRQGKFKSLQR
ncbi:MAG TPA: hypothetical protein VF200_03225 [Woeseiaceae bacterium]